jgi:hypothetical protein
VGSRYKYSTLGTSRALVRDAVTGAVREATPEERAVLDKRINAVLEKSFLETNDEYLSEETESESPVAKS